MITLLAIAAVAIAAPDVDAATASYEPTASAAKKSSKKLRNKATNYLKGALWSHIEDTGSGTLETLVTFCTNGNYAYRKTNYNGSLSYQTYFEGSWRVRTAGKSSAKIDYTIENFKSVYIDGSPGPDSSPGSAAVLAVTARSSSQAIIDGVPFSRNAGTC
jgi:hypothetical protein